MKKHLLTYGAIVLTLVAAMAFAPAPPDVKAGGRCGGYSSCGYSAPTYYYSQPEYIYVDRVIPVAYPVPFTVAVPVVSYLWNGGYGAPGYSPVYAAQPAMAAPTVTTPQQQPMQQQPAAPQSSRGTGDTGAPRTSALLQLSDAELDYLISRIEERLAARAANGNGTPKNGKPTSTPPPPVPQEPQARSYSDADVLRVLSAKNGSKSCMDCHTGAGAKGGVRIFESPGVLNPNANWAKIWDAADSGRMPKEAQNNKNAIMSDADVEVLRWKMVNAGRY